LAGETEVLGENLPQCRFVHHEHHMLCPDANPGLRGLTHARKIVLVVLQIGKAKDLSARIHDITNNRKCVE
jgi:hypothetical protein